MNTATHGFRKILSDELQRRCTKNRAYSMRSFARDIGVSPSTLSEIFKGRYGVSSQLADKIADKLKVSDEVRAEFRACVESEHSRIRTGRSAARVRKKHHNAPEAQISLDAFAVISDATHYAILECLALEDAVHDHKWFAKRLGITEFEAETSIERLERVGLLTRKNGEFKAIDSFTGTSNGIPSSALRAFHKQILEKAIRSLEEQHIEERTVSTMVLAVDPADFAKADDAIKTFRREFEAKFCKPSHAKEVYALNVQFFRMTQKKELA